MSKIVNLLSSIFGYGLNFIDSKVHIYGISIIIFTILIKIIFFKWELDQKKAAQKNEKIQKELAFIKEKYKNNQQMMNTKTLELYKREKVNPCSTIFFLIFQIIMLFSLLDLVYSPLTYVKKVPKDKLNQIKQEYAEMNNENNSKKFGLEIDIQKKLSEKYPEIKTNYSFFGLDLTETPAKRITNIKEIYKYENFGYILIPLIYIIVAFLNMHISMKDIEKQREKAKTNIVKDPKNEEYNKLDANDFQDALMDSQKMMKYIMPALIFSVTMSTPLIIALYWLTSSILDIGKLKLINKIIEKEKA